MINGHHCRTAMGCWVVGCLGHFHTQHAGLCVVLAQKPLAPNSDSVDCAHTWRWMICWGLVADLPCHAQ